MEYNAIDLLVGAIYKSVGVEPRYTEIAVGILGNMACQREACAVMASNTKVMELIYWTIQISTDAPLLVETTRLVTTIIDSIREQVRLFFYFEHSFIFISCPALKFNANSHITPYFRKLRPGLRLFMDAAC